MDLNSAVYNDPQYANWLTGLKDKVRNARIKAAISVNRELLWFYWELGTDIVQKQAQSNWGDGFLNQLSKDLMAEFPEMKGFSRRNLELIRQWYLFYTQPDLPVQIAKQPVSQLSNIDNKVIGQQAVAQLQEPDTLVTRIPWGHNIAIVAKCKNREEALYYVQSTLNHNWSRSVLVHQIESGLYHREGKAITNFSTALPKPQSDLALQTIKDPYVFDFMALSANYNEGRRGGVSP